MGSPESLDYQYVIIDITYCVICYSVYNIYDVMYTIIICTWDFQIMGDF